MAKILDVGHIQLYTTDLQKSVCFYEALGGKVLQYEDIALGERTIHMAMISLGSTAVELSERSEFVPPDYKTLPCICHYCLTVDDLPAFVEELRGKGIDSFETPGINHMTIWGGISSIFLRGPSNEKIELLQKK